MHPLWIELRIMLNMFVSILVFNLCGHYSCRFKNSSLKWRPPGNSMHINVNQYGLESCFFTWFNVPYRVVPTAKGVRKQHESNFKTVGRNSNIWSKLCSLTGYPRKETVAKYIWNRVFFFIGFKEILLAYTE